MPSLYHVDHERGVATLFDDQDNPYEVPLDQLPPDIQPHWSTGAYADHGAAYGAGQMLPPEPPPAPPPAPPAPPPPQQDPAAVRQELAEGAKRRLGFLGGIALNPVEALTEVAKRAVRPAGEFAIEAASGRQLPTKQEQNLGGMLGVFQPKGEPTAAPQGSPPAPGESFFFAGEGPPETEPMSAPGGGMGIGLGYSGPGAGGGYQADLSGIERAQERANNALDALGKAQERGFKIEEKSIAESREELEQARARYAAAGAEAKQKADEALARYESISEQMVNWKEDPNRLWSNKSALEQGIAAIFSGISQALVAQGVQRENVVLKAINRAIDRDVAAQRAEFQKLQAQGSMASNAYSMAMQQYGDAKQAELALTAMHKESLALKAKEAALKATREAARATLETRGAELELEAEKDKVKLAHDAARLGQEDYRLRLQEMQVLAGPPKARVPWKGVEKFGEQAVARQQLLDLAQFMNERVSEGSHSIGDAIMAWASKRLPATEARSYENVRSIIARAFTKATEGGRPSDFDFKEIRKNIPGASDSPMIWRDKWNWLMGMAEDNYRAQYESAQAAGYDVSGFKPPTRTALPPGGGFPGGRLDN